MPIDDFVKLLEVKRYSPRSIETYASVLRQMEKGTGKAIDRSSEKRLFDYIYVWFLSVIISTPHNGLSKTRSVGLVG